MTSVLAMRATRWVGAIALVCVMALAATVAHPPQADAFAWKDNCVLTAYNQNSEQSMVHPVVYTPLLPTPAVMAAFAAFAIAGLPTDKGATFANPGFPFSNGCRAFLHFTNPGQDVSCNYAAPTRGANTFQCSGNADWGIAKDDDDIVGEVKFGGFFTPPPIDPATDRDGDGDSDSSVSPALDPATTPTALRASELPGDDWVDSQAIGDFGRAGGLMLAGDLPDGCAKDDDALAPEAVRTAQLVRHGGDQGVGAMDYLQRSADDASASVREALSSASLSCLTRLLESGDSRTDVSYGEVPDQALTGDATGRRLVIKRGTSTDYLDIIGQTDGRHAQVLMVASNDDPMPAAVTLAALRRIG